MSRLIFFTFLFCLLVSVSFGQKIITNSTENSQTISIPNVPTISDTEWKVLTDALSAENWDRAAVYSWGLLNRLKIDNDAKQIARLRYFYLYALAGQILKAHDVGKKTEEDAAWRELDKAVEPLIGKEFVLPPREYRSTCEKNLNFICPVKDNEKALRTTATNKEGKGILSFDYVVFEKKVDLKDYNDKQIFLGGTLKKVEFNEELSDEQPWIMYLIFEKGFVRVVVNE
jgi:hypothetical protein